MSNDLISRKAVIDILESIRLNDCNAARRYVAADIQESVENLPTAYDVDNGDWIPVEQGLPKKERQFCTILSTSRNLRTLCAITHI